MRALYLIFSHENPQQLARLSKTIRSLSPESEIAIHHDPSKQKLNKSIIPSDLGVQIIPNPVPGEWGDFSQVRQYLHALSWSLENINFDWVFTLTGLTYPITDLSEFEHKIASLGYDAFIWHFDAFDTNHWPSNTGRNRYLFKYYKLPRFRYYYKVPEQIRNFLEATRELINESGIIRITPMPMGKTRLGIRRHKTPFNEKFLIYGGRQALNINRKSLLYIFEFLEGNPWYTNYFEDCLLPDEAFFNTILGNNRELKISNTALRYIKWPKQHAARGAVILEKEIPYVLQSKEPFALKLDSRIDPNALDKIDNYLKRFFK